jgi:hypothetical protein
MVIITTLIAKIYFPESLDRGRGPLPTLPRRSYNSYSYRRSKDDDAAAAARPPPESSTSGGSSGGGGGGAYYGSENDDDDDEDEVLDSGDNDDDDDDDDEEESDLLRNNPNHSKRYNILEFDQDRTSKAQVMQRLLFCSLMLNITFVTWGALQVCTVLYRTVLYLYNTVLYCIYTILYLYKCNNNNNNNKKSQTLTYFVGYLVELLLYISQLFPSPSFHF